jgi:hypothetical protein
MSDELWLITASALSLAGMAWLALAMEVHWGQVMQRPAHAAIRTRQALRMLGAVALPLALLACLRADRPSMAVLVWLMLLAASAVLVAMLLAHWPRAATT